MYDIEDEYMQHDSNEDSSSASNSSPIDEKVSPTTRNTKIVDFGIVGQPRELRIRSTLSTYERVCLVQLLISYLDIFAWSYEDISGLDPSIVQHFCPMPDRLSKS